MHTKNIPQLHAQRQGRTHSRTWMVFEGARMGQCVPHYARSNTREPVHPCGRTAESRADVFRASRCPSSTVAAARFSRPSAEFRP